MDAVKKYVQENHPHFVEELIRFLRIPSISAKSVHRSDCRQAARFLVEELQRLGLEVAMHETSGNPIVFAEYKAPNPASTILFYGHYDVQPEEPLDLWDSPPFEPDIRNGNLYARGASDDKGQVYAHVKAVDSLLKTQGNIPVNLKFLIEGEEEIASAHLDSFIQANRDLLKADIAVISDSSQYGPGCPAICYGLRGICALEVRLDASRSDLHSGSFGGAVPNPCNILCDMISQLKDADGRILIPGFYDDVLPLEDWERKAFASLPWDDRQFQEQLGIPGLQGEKGYSTLERKWARPTLDVNGIFGGYSGEGAKTIIPAWAGAKITMRLVPNQKAETIFHLFETYFESIRPPYIDVTITHHGGGGPVLVPRDARFMEEAIQALKYGFGKEPVFIREGGSIPVVSTIKEELGLHTLLLGFGLPDDHAHAPNEKLNLQDFQKGILTSASFMQRCGMKESLPPRK